MPSRRFTQKKGSGFYTGGCYNAPMRQDPTADALRDAILSSWNHDDGERPTIEVTLPAQGMIELRFTPMLTARAHASVRDVLANCVPFDVYVRIVA